MTFPVIKKFGGARYDAFNDQTDARSPAPVAWRSTSGVARTPSVDMISFPDDEETPSPTSPMRGSPPHARTLSDESTSFHLAAAFGAPSVRPRRTAPQVPETMEVHLRRLGPDAGAQRDHLAKSILRWAATEWAQPYPMPASLQRMSVQSFKHVHVSDDTAARNAWICTAGLYSPDGAAKQFWALARNAVLEVYIQPRPDAADPGRSAYYPKARAEIERSNPALYAQLARIDATDFSQPAEDLLSELRAQPKPIG